jgi:hypothetical protein
VAMTEPPTTRKKITRSSSDTVVVVARSHHRKKVTTDLNITVNEDTVDFSFNYKTASLEIKNTVDYQLTKTHLSRMQ